jgi:HD-like signal output (HDOD) protein
MVEMPYDHSRFSSILCDIAVDPDGVPSADLILAEESSFGVNHQDLGAVLCEQWKFPRSLVCATANHHDPTHLSGDEAMMPWFVHVADRLSAGCPGGFRLDLPDLEISSEASDVIGLGPVGFRAIAEALEHHEDEIQISMAA